MAALGGQRGGNNSDQNGAFPLPKFGALSSRNGANLVTTFSRRRRGFSWTPHPRALLLPLWAQGCQVGSNLDAAFIIKSQNSGGGVPAVLKRIVNYCFPFLHKIWMHGIRKFKSGPSSTSAYCTCTTLLQKLGTLPTEFWPPSL